MSKTEITKEERAQFFNSEWRYASDEVIRTFLEK